MPALNIAYQATALGIASGIISPTTHEINKLLNLPKGFECPIAVSIGYAGKNTDDTPRKRKPLKILAVEETF